MTATDGLLPWLLEQLDADEEKASACPVRHWLPDSAWFADMLDPLPSQRRDRPGWVPMITPEDVQHIATHDPARVLRQVVAARLRVAELQRQLADDPTDETARYLLRVEAMPFADRPGFDPRWAPPV